MNGSGKHNNWSLWTDTGVNLLAPDALNGASGNAAAFPTVMAAIVRGVDMHGDMMRSAIASPGNDFRLGACEAPPAILSAYLGEVRRPTREDQVGAALRQAQATTDGGVGRI